MRLLLFLAIAARHYLDAVERVGPLWLIPYSCFFSHSAKNYTYSFCLICDCFVMKVDCTF